LKTFDGAQNDNHLSNKAAQSPVSPLDISLEAIFPVPCGREFKPSVQAPVLLLVQK
jgi:hypothetical protein